MAERVVLQVGTVKGVYGFESNGERGGWRCFAGCGGGDLVGFHMRLRGLGFRAAVRELLEVRR